MRRGAEEQGKRNLLHLRQSNELQMEGWKIKVRRVRPHGVHRKGDLVECGDLVPACKNHLLLYHENGSVLRRVDRN